MRPEIRFQAPTLTQFFEKSFTFDKKRKKQKTKKKEEKEGSVVRLNNFLICATTNLIHLEFRKKLI